ncbi:MAG: sigma-70 family RNA polymerase sigma factor [Sedimentisphaerales bacterium]|nr:sigma-70 family RNA polymerase sigma factor [Sedimentisphaerales bacterium]
MDDQKENQAEIDESLWSRYRETRSISDRNKIVEHYLPWAKCQAFVFARNMPQVWDVDDLLSEGIFGLMRAVEKFDFSRGYLFTSYAKRRVWGSMMDAVRSQSKCYGWVRSLKSTSRRFQIFSLDSNIPGLDDKAQAENILDENMPDPANNLQREDFRKILFSDFNHREKILLDMLFYKGVTQKETARQFSKTPPWVSQTRKNLIARLKSKPGLRERLQSCLAG